EGLEVRLVTGGEGRPPPGMLDQGHRRELDEQGDRRDGRRMFSSSTAATSSDSSRSRSSRWWANTSTAVPGAGDSCPSRTWRINSAAQRSVPRRRHWAYQLAGPNRATRVDLRLESGVHRGRSASRG